MVRVLVPVDAGCAVEGGEADVPSAMPEDGDPQRDTAINMLPLEVLVMILARVGIETLLQVVPRVCWSWRSAMANM